MKNNRITKNKNKARIIVIISAALIVTFLMCAFFSIIPITKATEQEETAGTYIISSNADLKNYVDHYNNGGRNPEDTLEIAVTSGTSIDLSSGFAGIGNSTRPFKGRIEFTQNALTIFSLNGPLFDTVTTDLKIVTASSDTAREITVIRTGSGDTPLLANNVKNSSEQTPPTAEWIVRVEQDGITDPSNPVAHSFAGVINEIDDGCKVNVTFEHASIAYGVPADVSSAGDVGLICCTLGSGAELNVTLKSTSNTGFTVSSTGGHAGGIVGVMEDGSSLTLNDTNNSSTTFSAISTVSSSTGYAGGIVGYATNAVAAPAAGKTKIEFSREVSGGSNGGAGGLYGYYKSTKENSGAAGGTRIFDLKDFQTGENFTISGGKSCGGVIGTLEAENNVTVTETGVNIASDAAANFTKKVNFTNGIGDDYRGGIIGSYSNNSLANTLYFNNVEVNILSTPSGTYKGGILGYIVGDSAAYVKFNDVYAAMTSGASVNGGILASMGQKGSFVDFTGTAKVTGGSSGCASGLIRYQNYGVVRLAGTTDLSGVTYTHSQLIGDRGNGLVYALGSGTDANWTFKRGTGYVDDIGDWGEVLRNITESTFFTVDMSAHTVTMAAAVNPMTNVTDFIKTALNIQHNVSDQPETGALRFTDGDGNTSANLLAANSALSMSDDIDLSGTGIVALTRDNGGNEYFKGTFNGGTHTLTLAIGEAYGKDKNGNAVTAKANAANGMIIKHAYQGLFAKAQGATFQNLTLAGYDCTSISGGGNIGGLAAVSKGNLTLTNITTSQENKVWADSSDFKCGGAIGTIETGAGTITVTDCTFDTKTNDFRQNNDKAGYFGGCIGYVDSTSANTFNFTRVNIGATEKTAYPDQNSRLYQKDNNKSGKIYYGGLIGVFKESGTKRTVNLKNITVNDGVYIQSQNNTSGARANGNGAFIGSVWYDVNVTIGDTDQNNGITVGNGSTTIQPKIEVMSGSSSGNIGALFYQATGKMDVHHVNIAGMNISSSYSGSDSSLGIIVNDTVRSSASVLYLNVDMAEFTNGNLKTGYYIDSAKTSISAGKFSEAFDEIAAYSHANGKDICDNDSNAIVSLNIPDGARIIMDGENCNTYQNQTSYATKTNEHTRYYYNLEAIRTIGSPTPAEKLLMWSVNKYAHSSVENLFNNGFTNTISGNCDMSGYSYYPVDASGMTISGATIKFYNQEIESGEGVAAAKGNTDSSARSTHTSTQHYLMHEGIFRNYTGTLTVNGLTVQGNVSNQHDNDHNSGFLICGTLGNVNERTVATLNNITLNNASVSGRSSGEYSPLLLNKIGKNVEFSLTGVTATGYPSLATTGNVTETAAVASSLIGEVGSDDAENINMTFSQIKLDARDSTGALSNLTTAYGTDRSIFDLATILYSFKSLRGSLGVYNYINSEDWTNNAHAVTYGKEITTSVEYANKEKKYYDESNPYFTDPTLGTNSSGEYDFSTGFLPYVYNGGNTYSPATNKYHEIKVNVRDVELINGCGQYNDPYQITTGGLLAAAAKIINNSIDANTQICLPTDLTDDDVSSLDMWCTNTSTHAIYKYNGTVFVNESNNADTKTANTVREYLAGAYYAVLGNITIDDSNYPGLGCVSDWRADSGYDCKYAFRGVIVGNGGTITNKTAEPLIKISNGCVIKNLTVKVDATIAIAQTNNNPFRYDAQGCASYGAVIGQVMGGDTIIDQVGVEFSSNFSVTYNSSNNAYARLMPVGGYIGVIVNGGVVFRNMSAVAADKKAGLTSSVCSYAGNNSTSNSNAWLYVNPIIGRVITGYAFTEVTGTNGNAYKYAEDTVTMKNGTKNYSIPDLDTTAGKLGFTATSSTISKITVPNAQALYVLSCIVNTGAGSAKFSTTATEAYPDISTDPWVSAYRNYTSTHCANYNQVGTVATADYTVVHAQDVYSGSTKIPYIIRAYTEKTTYGTGNDAYDIYHARSICGNKNNNSGKITVGTIEFAETTYNLPEGYRGIGNIYSDDNAFKLYFNNLDGKSATVNLSMSFREYDFAGNNNKDKIDDSTIGSIRDNENYNECLNPGFGLFNIMYACNNDGVIKDLTLTGSIVHEALKLSSDSKTLVEGRYKSTTNTNNLHNSNKVTNQFVTSKRVISVGGLAGYTANKFNLKNINLNGLSVSSMKYGGGLIGYAYNKPFSIEDCGTGSDGVSVEARVKAGGMIGYVSGGNTCLTIKQTNSNISFTINQVKTTFEFIHKEDYYESNQNYFDIYTAGGLIGTIKCGNTEDTTKLNIENVIIRGKSGAASSHVTTTAIPNANHLNHRDVGGGVIGSCLNTDYNICGVKVTGVSVHGGVAGGIIGFDGFNSETSGPAHTIDSTVVDGSDAAVISSVRTAGGMIGKSTRFQAKSKSEITISNDIVKNITICSEARNTASSNPWQDDCAAGTAMGSLYNLKGFENGGYCTANIYNYTAENCTVYTLFRNVTSDSYKFIRDSGTGGIIGTIANGGTNNANISNLYGHNILLNNVTVRNYDGEYSINKLRANSKSTGYVCGNNYTEGVIKIVGISLQNMNNAQISYISGKSTAAANTEYFGNGGYVIMADYDGVSAGNSKNTNNSSVYPSYTAANEYTAAAPYVTVNPGLNIGSYLLTGDSMSSAAADLPYNDILGATNTPNTFNDDTRYNIANNTITNSSDNKKAKNYTVKLSTYNTEQGANIANDFAVLVVDDLSRKNTNEMINAYINLITNTAEVTNAQGQNGYGINKANVYTVDIYKMVYENGAFTKANGEAALKRDDPADANSKLQFYMVSGENDTLNGNTFSLIDISYYDPADTSKVAYHLYVPVIVRKLLKYDFNLAIQSGTDYYRDDYANENSPLFGKPAMENIGMPITMYFEYIYDRSEQEWNTALANGDVKNPSKKIQISYTGTQYSGVIDPDTVLVLVDPNNNGKHYYAKFSDLEQTGTDQYSLSLSAFNESPDGTGSDFSVANFDKYLPLHATRDDSAGRYIKLDNTATAALSTLISSPGATIVTVGDDRYYYVKPDDTIDTLTARYTITVDHASYENITEYYYISLFTEEGSVADGLLCHYIISGYADLGDNSIPSRIKDPSQLTSNGGYGNAHLFLGNIFDLDVTVTSTNPNEVMDEINNYVGASITSTVKINEHIFGEVAPNLADTSGIDVYQSFLMYLTMYTETGNKTLITGDPTASVDSYTIAYTNTENLTSQQLAASGLTTISLSEAERTASIPTGSLDGSFIELKNGKKLNAFLRTRVNEGAVITADATLTYNYVGIGYQFPFKSRDEDPYGTRISANSSVGYNIANTAYSKATVHAEDINDGLYYCYIDLEGVNLTYNVINDDVFKGDYGPLGINPLDGELTRLNVPTIADYDVTNIIDDTVGYDYIKCTVRLMQKLDGSGTERYQYSDPLVISKFWTNAWINTKDPSTDTDVTISYTESADHKSYVFIIPKAYVQQGAYGEEFLIPIHYTVLTGSEFENSSDAEMIYSNYKIKLTVNLCKANGTEDLSKSVAEDYIIYTNARVYPDYLAPSN